MTKLVLRLEPLALRDVFDDAPDPEPAPVAAPAASALPLHVVDLESAGLPSAGPAPLARWVATVAAAHDPCLVLDIDGRVLSVSSSAADVLGCSDVAVIGRPLLDVIDLVDFETGGSQPDYAARIAPLAVLAPNHGLMRSLLRVRRHGNVGRTVDVSSAPLHDANGQTVGSFTFLASVHG